MNRQTSKLLTILLDSPGHFFQYEDLAERLGVSTRSVRNYIQSIQDFLKTQKLSSCLAVSDGEIAFTGSPEISETLLSAAVDNDFYLYRLSPEERTQIISLYLLISSDYCNLNELSEKFHASRTTLLKDMEQVKRQLALNGVTFHPAMNKGYLLQAEEFQRREVIFRLIRSSKGAVFSLQREVNIYERFLYDEWNLEDYFPVIRKLLLDTEQRYGLDANDASFEELLFMLSLIVHRLRGHQLIEEYSPSEKPFENPFVYELAGHLLEQLANHYDFSYNDAETGFLASRIYYSRFYDSCYPENAKNIRMHMALITFLMKIANDISIPVHEDTNIINQLENHLKDIEKAYSKGITLENDYTEQMIAEYPDLYQLILRYLFILESAYGHPYSRDNTAVLLIYLVVAINRHSKKNQPPGVILVCHTGIGTANFLAEQLNSYFNIRILAITSNHKLADVKKLYQYDLILSTISLQEPEDTWVKVSPMLTEKDILKLQKIFVDMNRCKNQLHLSPADFSQEETYFNVLIEANIRLDIGCADWQSVITQSAAPLLAEGSIDNRYVSAMIQSCKTNGAYFVYCPGVALAHAGADDGVHAFGLSLTRLKQPVIFGHKQHDPVSWCICMAVPEQDEKLYQVLRLMNLFTDSGHCKHMSEMSSPKELLAYIKKNIQEDRYGKQ